MPRRKTRPTSGDALAKVARTRSSKPKPEPIPASTGPPELVIETVPAAPAPAEEPALEPALEPEPALDDGAAAGYLYPDQAEGSVVTLRDYGEWRMCRDSKGRRIRQRKGSTGW